MVRVSFAYALAERQAVYPVTDVLTDPFTCSA